MWDYSPINNNWKQRVDKLDKKTYNYLRQEIEDVRFYSKCLEGTTYVPVQNLSDIYDSLNYIDENTYKLDKTYSSKSINTDVNDGVSIERGSLSDKGILYRYNSDYGYTVKNYFSPKRLIESYSNYLTVDIATVENININKKYSKIDNVFLKEGHRILVKDNITNVSIPSSIDPNEYFSSNFYLKEEIGNTKTYYYFNSDNGIYKIVDGGLIRENDLDNYDQNIRYSVHVKLGSNSHIQYHLKRMLNGNYPMVSNSDPIEFEVKSNYIIRNSVEYKNTLDNQFYSGIFHGNETLNSNNKKYQIPERFVSVGDFGFIVNSQYGKTNLIQNKFKEDLKDITSLSDKYISVGSNGTILNIDKVNMDISYVNINQFENLNSVDFVSDKRGVVCGENGFIIKTEDQFNYKIVETDVRNNLNKIKFTDLSNYVTIGNNGIVRKFNFNSDVQEQIDLSIKTTLYDQKSLIDDLTDIQSINIKKNTLKISDGDYFDIPKKIGDSSFSFDFRFKLTDITNPIQTIFSFLTTKFPTTSGSTLDKGIKISIEKDINDVSRINLYVNSTDGSEILKIDGNIKVSQNQWYHIMVTRNQGVYKFHIDQKLSGSISNGYVGNFNNFNDRIRIGSELTYNDSDLSYSSSSFNNIDGVIDQIRFYDKELDDKEVIDFSNNYIKELDGLIGWYKFNLYKAELLPFKLNTFNIIDSNEKIILPNGSSISEFNNTNDFTLIDTEKFKSIIISGGKFISIIVEPHSNYSNQVLNNQIFIKTYDNTIKGIVFNSIDNNLYGVGESLFKVDLNYLDVDLFNNINLSETKSENILNNGYNNIDINLQDQKLYLIGSDDNEIEEILISEICNEQILNPIENCGIYATISTIINSNSLSIENDYRNDVIDTENINSIEYIKVLGFPESNQSVLKIPVKLPNGDYLPNYQKVYCSLTISELVNGYFEISMDGINFTKIKSNGDYLFPTSVGSSILTIRAILNNDSVGNKIKGIVKNIVFYDSDCVKTEFDKKHTESINFKKLYFSQFDTQENLEKLRNGFLYSYIDIKSLKINDEEKIYLGTYSNSNFPKYLYENQFDEDYSVRCGLGGLCEHISYLSNPVFDRITYGMDFEVINNGQSYGYLNDSYGILEAFQINGSQQIGIDIGDLSNGDFNIDSPYYVGIDYTKSFYFEVDSMIIDHNDLLFDTIREDGQSFTYSQNINIDNNTFTYGTMSEDFFNKISLSNTNDELDVLLHSSINENQVYYIEGKFDGDVRITIGNIDTDINGTGDIINTIIRSGQESNSLKIISLSNGSSIENFVITDRLPTKSKIEWNPNTCKQSYSMSGYDEELTGFLQKDGNGSYTAPCELLLECDTSSNVSEILGNEYLNKFSSKMLFTDYEIASKLYFFDTITGDYQLPDPIYISDINKLEIKSITNQKSWIDYSKDSTKEFEYLSNNNEINSVKYKSSFSLENISSSFDIILNDKSTIDLSDINGSSSGLLPNFGDNITLGSPNDSSYDVYIFDNFFIFKRPAFFNVDIGDVIRIENSLINDNFLVISKNSNINGEFIYVKTNFNNSIIKSLSKWVKSTKIINLNNFKDINELIYNFNNHPISIGYEVSDNDDGTLKLESKFNHKTSYYNMQCSVLVTSPILDVTNKKMEYVNKFLSFGYSPTYNIMDYLSNEIFDKSYEILSIPSYRFTNNNSGVIYTISTGKISFNSSLKEEWESFDKNIFIDMIYDTVSIESVLIIDKYYDQDSDRYILQTYDFYGHVYNQTNINSLEFTLRGRNKLIEISKDLQKMNNIQKSSSNGYQITDLGNNLFNEYVNLESNLNFKPNTDNYVKKLLNDSNIKKHLSGIVYLDSNNELCFNVINLPKKESNKLYSIDEYGIDCEDCVYQDYIMFENPENNIVYNQFAILGTSSLYTYYTNRIPALDYKFFNNIRLENTSGSGVVDIPIEYVSDNNSSNKIIEFIVEKVDGGYIEIVKNNIVLQTINYRQYKNRKVKSTFNDNGIQNLIIRIHYNTGSNSIDITNIRVGNMECESNCHVTQLKIPDHGLSIGSGFVIEMENDIFNLDNIYSSEFTENPISGWILDDNGSTSNITILNSVIDLPINNNNISIYTNESYDVNSGEVYRMTFEYEMSFIQGTPSIYPFFMNSNTLVKTNIESFSVNGDFQRVEINFVPTSNNIKIGFTFDGESIIKLREISLDKIDNIGSYYDGFHVVKEVINNDIIVIDSEYKGKVEEISMTYSFINKCGESVIKTKLSSEIGIVTTQIFDPYFKYRPIDIFELGIDEKVKQAIEIKTDQWTFNNEGTVSLLDTIDMKNYRFRLIDGLSIIDLNDKYPWILESEIREALIGKDQNGIVWYKGIWDCGRWFGGTWYSGDFRGGVWYDGTWNNSLITDDVIKAKVEVLDSSIVTSKWYSGTWFNGTWNNGLWFSGSFYDGTWNKGIWQGGTWFKGTWNSGTFNRGTWIDGTWNSGTFNSDLGTSNWFDGKWESGNFESGIWHNGHFGNVSKISTFGSRSTRSKKSIWESGNFINGTFNSGDSNIDNNLSTFKTGYWNSGTWNGGTTHQITWNNGTWNNGVVKDISVVAFYGDSKSDYFFTLKGIWKFRENDIFYIINNGVYNEIYGSDESVQFYKVDKDYIIIGDNEYTKIIVKKVPIQITNEIVNGNGKFVEGYVNNNLPSDNNIMGEKITSLVPYFSNSKWYNGQFNNGVFDGEFFRDGIWNNGVFKSGDFGY